MKIRCPKCAWEPDGRPYWGCDSCHCVFDTFSTGARCPQCARSWLETQCIKCGVWSLHEDWYDGYWGGLVNHQENKIPQKTQEPLPSIPGEETH